MSLTDLASLGTFVSSFAVLVSLIFLGVQTRQSTRNQRATIHHERLATVQDLVLLIASGEATVAFMRGSAGDDTLSDVETARYLHLATCTMRIMEELFYQHRDGMLDKTRWASTTRRMQGFLIAPGFRAAWLASADAFEPDYRNWVDALAHEATGVNPNAMIPMWKSLVKQELQRASAAAQA